MTIFCYFNQDNPSIWASRRTGCKRTLPGSLKTSKVETTDYHVWDAMLVKCHKLQPKPKTTDASWKSPSRPFWQELPQEHVNKAAANFTKCLTGYYGCGCQWRSLRAFAATMFVPKSASLYHANKPALFRDTNRPPVKTTLGTLRNGGLSWLNNIILSFSDTGLFKQNLVVKFHAKICVYINKSHGGYFFNVHSVNCISNQIACSVVWFFRWNAINRLLFNFRKQQ